MYKVYILYSKSKDKYYIGHTHDLLNRLDEHNKKSNLGTNDWEIKYFEEFGTRGEAMKREVEIKNKKRRSYIENLIRTFG